MKNHINIYRFILGETSKYGWIEAGAVQPPSPQILISYTKIPEFCRASRRNYRKLA